ncbi:MAG: DNRLRE domain-containing protein, partial [Deltaproteobacteria bacterium]|nr:DNRLRE domain-containing protein [Deltaproteobacteria bacterium]
TVDLDQASNVYMCPVAGDVYLDEESCDNNFDHKTRIMVASNTINHYGLGRGLIKFEIPSEIMAPQIDNATVHMMTTDSTGEGGEVNLAALNVAFDEDAATWNSVGTGAYDTESKASGTTPGENSIAFTLDVTGLLQNKLDKVRDYGTMLLFDDEYQTPSVHENIYTREAYGPGTVGPYLEIKLARPDFVVSAASAEWYDADDASQGYAVNYTLYNQGAGLGGNSMLCLWVDENAAVDLDCPQLSAGGSLSGLFSGPFVVAGDNDTLLLCANGGAACDGFDTLQEDNETNNCYAFVVEPPPHPGIPTSTTSVSGNDNDVNNGDNPGGDNSNGRPPATTTTSVIPVTTTTTTVNEPDVATTTTTVAELPAPVTTTTTTPVGRCFLRKVLPDEDASVLNMFRQFRDRRLLSSPAGRRLVADYYAHGTEIMKILQADAALRAEVRRLVWVLAPAVAADMQSGEAIRLTALQYAAFVDILARMRPRASAALQAMIDEMREKIYAGELFEWAGLRSAYAAE